MYISSSGISICALKQNFRYDAVLRSLPGITIYISCGSVVGMSRHPFLSGVFVAVPRYLWGSDVTAAFTGVNFTFIHVVFSCDANPVLWSLLIVMLMSI